MIGAVAFLTGAFCVGLGAIISAVLLVPKGYEIAVVTFVSGLTGSLLAQLVLDRD